MSTTVSCPDCDEKVTLRPGRSSAKCPACGSSVRADDRSSARAGRRRDDDEDDDREERKRPKRKYREEWDDDDEDDRKPPPKPKGSLAWLWITLVVLGVVVAGCGGLVYFVFSAVRKVRDDVVQRNEAFRQKMTAEPGNPQGRPKHPPQPDASTYPKNKPFDADPQLTKAGPVFLDDLSPFDVKQGAWPLGRHGAMGAPDGRWVVVNGTYHDHALGLHPADPGTARVSFAVGGLARRLKGKVALNDEWHGNDAWNDVTFAVYKDGKEVWRSPPTRKRKVSPLEFDLDVTGARVITLETSAPNGSHDAHCVWLDPLIEK